MTKVFFQCEKFDVVWLILYGLLNICIDICCIDIFWAGLESIRHQLVARWLHSYARQLAFLMSLSWSLQWLLDRFRCYPSARFGSTPYLNLLKDEKSFFGNRLEKFCSKENSDESLPKLETTEFSVCCMAARFRVLIPSDELVDW